MVFFLLNIVSNALAYLLFYREVYNQIISTLTLSHMSKIFEKRKNFDLRRLLAGSERLIDHLLIHRSNRNNTNKSKTIRYTFMPILCNMPVCFSFE